MKNSKNSFVFYKSFYESIRKIPEEYQLELYNAICMYSLEGEESMNLSGIAEAIFILIKPNIDSAQKKYKASVENGKRGGRPRKETQEEPNQNLNVDVEENLQKRFIECTSSTNLNAISECLSYLQDLPFEVIETALIKTSEKNGGWKYAKTILNNWLKAGINTIEKVKAEELNYKSKNRLMKQKQRKMKEN